MAAVLVAAALMAAILQGCAQPEDTTRTGSDGAVESMEEKKAESAAKNAETGHTSDEWSLQSLLGLGKGFQQDSYVGRFVCLSAGVDVGMYRTGTQAGGSFAQAIVDRYDSAALIPYGDGVAIADHDYQGFSGIASVKEGDTAELELDGRHVALTCVLVTEGNKSTGITLDDGTAVDEALGDQVLAYTCTEDAGRVAVTIWNVAGAVEGRGFEKGEQAYAAEG